ncbi:unnamed protein product [Mytilus coruscus]|uniref:Uncharacterized protein n=1 Tax=Mytilus coruscus TaxID=42192 RepID=A0A6J8AFK5_MYTCO|nr:unnamed protein product [Mytilus coruscus]
MLKYIFENNSDVLLSALIAGIQEIAQARQNITTAKGDEIYTLDPLDTLASMSKICSSSVPVDSTLDNLLSGQEFVSPVKQVTCSVIPSMVSSVSDSEKNHCKMMGSLHSTSHVSSAVGIDQPMTGIPLTDSASLPTLDVFDLCLTSSLDTPKGYSG